MAGNIFINYRRGAASGTAGRLHDRLANAFGKNSIFMDVDHIPAGVDFVAYLEAKVAQCEIFLVVIGPDWLDVRGDNGKRRLENPEDFVSIEIAAALNRDIRVIPVLVDGARMPSAADLPESLKPLVRRNAVDVRNAQFGRDAEALVKQVDEALRGSGSRRTPWRIAAMGAAVVVLAIAGLYYVYYGGVLDALLHKREAVVADGAVAKGPPGAPSEPASAIAPGSRQSFSDRLADGQPCPACPEMVVVPGGEFLMGSPESEPDRETLGKGTESPVRVTIAKPFAVAKFAVTRGEFAAFVESGHRIEPGCSLWNGSQVMFQPDRSWKFPGFEQDDRHPVVCVSWNDAKAYVAWLASRTGKPYRLLSEAEREYVTRAKTTTPFWWGSSITSAQANTDASVPYKGGGGKGESRQRTVKIDTFEPNPWGLYNVHGNVWDWTEDCWAVGHAGNPRNGSARTAVETCSQRTMRGGSWYNYPRRARAAARESDFPAARYSSVGFRVARDIAP
jgi:formylglycine-generating enzyme required for sulfatase activity